MWLHHRKKLAKKSKLSQIAEDESGSESIKQSTNQSNIRHSQISIKHSVSDQSINRPVGHSHNLSDNLSNKQALDEPINLVSPVDLRRQNRTVSEPVKQVHNQTVNQTTNRTISRSVSQSFIAIKRPERINRITPQSNRPRTVHLLYGLPASVWLQVFDCLIEQSIKLIPDQSINQLINQSINQSISLSITCRALHSLFKTQRQSIRLLIQSNSYLINESINQSISPSSKQSHNSTINQTIHHKTSTAINQPHAHSAHQLVDLSSNQSINQTNNPPTGVLNLENSVMNNYFNHTNSHTNNVSNGHSTNQSATQKNNHVTNHAVESNKLSVTTLDTTTVNQINTNQSPNQPINQSPNRSTDRSSRRHSRKASMQQLEQAITQSIKDSNDHSVNSSNTQIIRHANKQSINELIKLPWWRLDQTTVNAMKKIIRPFNQSTDQPVTTSVKKSIKRSMKESNNQSNNQSANIHNLSKRADKKYVKQLRHLSINQSNNQSIKHQSNNHMIYRSTNVSEPNTPDLNHTNTQSLHSPDRTVVRSNSYSNNRTNNQSNNQSNHLSLALSPSISQSRSPMCQSSNQSNNGSINQPNDASFLYLSPDLPPSLLSDNQSNNQFWSNQVIPRFSSMINHPLTQRIWLKGIPAEVRCRIWSQAINHNQLNDQPHSQSIDHDEFEDCWRISQRYWNQSVNHLDDQSDQSHDQSDDQSNNSSNNQPNTQTLDQTADQPNTQSDLLNRRLSFDDSDSSDEGLPHAFSFCVMAEQSLNPTLDQSFNQSINQSNDHSINQPISQSNGQSYNQTMDQSNNHCSAESTDDSNDLSINQSNNRLKLSTDILNDLNRMFDDSLSQSINQIDQSRISQSLPSIDQTIHNILFAVGLSKSQSENSNNQSEELLYMQGLGYLTCLLSIYLSINDAFTVFTRLIDFPFFKSWLSMNVQSINQRFKVFQSLLDSELPTLSEHFGTHIPPDLYVMDYLLSFFVPFLSIEMCAKIFDLFLIQGEFAVFKGAIAMLGEMENDLLSSDVGQCCRKLKARINVDDTRFWTRFHAVKLTKEAKEFFAQNK